MTIDFRDDATKKVYFEIEAGEVLSSPVLLVAETGYEPARLPLAASVQPVPERTDLEVEAASFEHEDNGLGGQLSGSVWIDHNVEVVDRDSAVSLRCAGGSTLGRAAEGLSYVHLPATVHGRPSSISGIALEFNDSSYSVGAVARADGLDALVCDGFGELTGEKTSEFMIAVPDGASDLVFRIGCPCGGILTNDSWDDITTGELLSVSISLD